MDRNVERYPGGTATATANEGADDGPGADAHETPSLARGSSLGRYLIVDTVGVGGTGIVYSAFDPDLDRKVALKLLRKSQGQAARSRLLREAQAMAKLSHPNVVTVFEVGTDGQRDFVAMEFVDGDDLAGWIATPRDAHEILAVYRQAGEGLAAAHRAGLVHRDFKPQNVLIDGDNKVLVTDFGLARHSATEEGTPGSEPLAPGLSPLTRTGALMGTPAYMAPEQHLAHDADARSDQFSYCVALYEALAGQRPYAGKNYEELREAVTTKEANVLPDSVPVPASVRAALAKGMARDPRQRHASMEALLLELAPRPRRRGPLVAAAVVVALLLALVAVRMIGADEEPRCQFDRTMLAGVWDEGIRGQVAASFASTGVQGAEQVFSRLESIVDAYADDIVSLRKEVCKSSRGRRGEADELLVLRMSCLQRRRQELGALASAFSSVDPRGVDRVIEAAQALRPVSDCRDEQALARGVPGPPAAIRNEVEELQASLKDARLEGEAGHVKSAIARTEAANARSLDMGYLPLQAESYESLGHLYGRDLRMKDAERAYEEAILAAEESGYTEYRARALVGIPNLSPPAPRATTRPAGSRDAPRPPLPRAAATLTLRRMSTFPWRTSSRRKASSMRPSRSSSRACTAIGLSPKPRPSTLRVCKIASPTFASNSVSTKRPMCWPRAATSKYGPNLATRIRVLPPISQRWASPIACGARFARRVNWTKGSGRIGPAKRPRRCSPRTTISQTNSAPYAAACSGPMERRFEGATVVCAQRVIADARYLDAVWNARRDALERYSMARSGADGGFLCQRASQEDIVAVAEHETLGRSGVERVEAGTTDVRGLELRLGATGFLSGQVTQDGNPGQAQSVYAVPVGEQVARPPFAVVTFLRADGSYSFERLAPGRYKVFSGPRSSSASQVLHSQEVEIVSRRGEQLDFDQSEGDAGLSVRVVGIGGASVPTAQVLVVPGHIESQSGREFNEAAVVAGRDVQSHFWNAGAALLLGDLKSGAHSLCVVALGGDYRDPEYMSKFTKELLDSIPVHCQDINLVSGETLEIEVAVHALAPMVELDPEVKAAER